jgi:membrane protein DedA with SNARE-associated domain
LSVEVIATTGVGVAGVPVTFFVPTSGASAALWGPSTVVTNAAGVATSPPLVANDKVGSYIVWAVPSGLQSIAAFVLTNKRK